MKCYIDGIAAGNQSPCAVAFFISVKWHKLSCYVRENTSPAPLPCPACCQLLLFCLLSICNKCICDVKDACDMRYSTTATSRRRRRRTCLSQGATACSSSCSCSCSWAEETLASSHLCPCPCPFCCCYCCCSLCRCSPDMRYFSYNSCRCLD